MFSLWGDIKYSLQSIRSAPGYFASVIGIFGLGIAASVSVFTFVDGVVLRPLPYRDPGRLVMLTSVATKPPYSSNGSVSYINYERLKSQAKLFVDLAVTFRTGWSRVTVTGSGVEPEVIQGAFVSPNLFAMLGRTAALGRIFTEDENRRREHVIVLSEGTARRLYGSVENALGSTIEIGGSKWNIIGVMPQDVRFPFLNVQLWAPLVSHPEWDNAENGPPLQQPRWDVVGRLKPGVSIQTAQAEIDTIERGLRLDSPDEDQNEVRVVPMREYFTRAVSKPLWILFASVLFLLLIACGNVANLMLARVASRSREMAVRVAVGASRARIFQQLIIESIVLSSLAAAVGIAGARALVPVLKRFAPAGTPRLEGITIDGRVLVFSLVITLAAGLVLGLAPAFSAGRLSISERLRRSRLRSSLIAAEFAMAMVLLSGAGLLIRSFTAVLQTDSGYKTEHVLTMKVVASNNGRFYREVLDRIIALPGVQTAGAVSNLFFLDEERTHALRQAEGRAPEPKSTWKPLVWTQVTGAYFQTMGIPLLRGRFFNSSDRADTPPVVVINQTLARRYWPDQDPIGKHLKGFDPRGRNDDWLTVIGVVADVKSGGLERQPFSQIYELQEQRPEPLWNIVIRTAGNPVDVAASTRALVHSVDRTVVIGAIETLGQVIDEQETARRFQTWLITTFSVIALGLAALGVFAVLHYSVAARRREIGVRIAVGARSTHILRHVVGHGLRFALTGIAVGTLAAMWTTNAIASLLYRVDADDPLTFAGAAALLTAVAVLAAYLPALRATRVDPMAVLHED